MKGTYCEEKITICPKKTSVEETSPFNFSEELCFNNATCIDSPHAYNYSCNCSPGYTGRHCEIEIDECKNEPCLNGGKCFDKIGYYRCGCNEGYSGLNCEIQQDGCQKCANSSCIRVGRNKVKCLCPPGRTGMQIATFFCKQAKPK
jgi:Notch-like protein